MSYTADFVTNVWSYGIKVVKKKIVRFNVVPTMIEPVQIKNEEDSSSTCSDASVIEESRACTSFESLSTSVNESPLFDSMYNFCEEEEPVAMFIKSIPNVQRTLHSIREGEICINERLQVYFDLKVEEVYKP